MQMMGTSPLTESKLWNDKYYGIIILFFNNLNNEMFLVKISMVITYPQCQVIAVDNRAVATLS